jgi:hypothetical protein
MNNFTEWWEALSFPLKIYWSLAVPFTLFFVLQLVLSFFGGDDLDVPDDTPDAEIAGDEGIPFQFFSLKNLIAFFTLFGWVGIAAIDSGFSETMSIVLATIAGLIMMLIMGTVAYFLAKANADGSMKIVKAIGRSGEVYLTIPKRRSQAGKVQIVVQGSLRTLDAMTDDEHDIPNGRLIRVKEVINNNILIVTAQ